MATICFEARFEDSSGDGVDGLTPTWDIERITRSDGAYSALVTAGATNITIGRRGLYGYRLAGADLTLYDYVATAVTASDTPTVHEVAALWTLWSLSWHDILTTVLMAVDSIGKLLVDYLDATISSRAAPGDEMDLVADAVDTAALSASAVAEIQAGLATEENQTTILARIGAFTGSGLNTILGFLRAMMRKTASLTPSDVGGSYDNTSDSLEAIRDMLSVSATQVVAVDDGGNLTIVRGDGWPWDKDDLGAFTGYTAIVFSIKEDPDEDSDDNAVIRVRKNASGAGDGLLRKNGAAVTGADCLLGSITIDDESGGDITVWLDPAVTDDLVKGDYFYDVQLIKATSPKVSTLTAGKCTVRTDYDVTRGIT